MTKREYLFRVTAVDEIYDGDTFKLYLDIGFRQKMFWADIRLVGADTPELHKGTDREKNTGRVAKAFTTAWFDNILNPQPNTLEFAGIDKAPPASSTIWIRTNKDDQTFNRWLGEVWVEHTDPVQTTYLADRLIEEELAARWPLHWWEVYEPNSPYWNKSKKIELDSPIGTRVRLKESNRQGTLAGKAGQRLFVRLDGVAYKPTDPLHQAAPEEMEALPVPET